MSETQNLCLQLSDSEPSTSAQATAAELGFVEVLTIPSDDDDDMKDFITPPSPFKTSKVFIYFQQMLCFDIFLLVFGLMGKNVLLFSYQEIIWKGTNPEH